MWEIFGTLIVLVILLIGYCVYFGVPGSCPCYSIPGTGQKYFMTPASEYMVSSAQVAGIGRGFNQLAMPGSYADAMQQLHDVETMHLADVKSDLNRM